jgi:radical SAM protein with 4Fe4S-binding SPASM domain
LPDGKITLCEELYWLPQFITGDLMKQSIKQAWNSEKALALYHFSQDLVREQIACKACKDFDRCHQTRGVCWKQVLYAYGKENWDYPDPRCPYAPEPFNRFWIE